MSKITYEFYKETDAEAVASLMRNNQFWIGKYDENLTGEKFVDYQRKKGTIFGIVGKKDDKVVSLSFDAAWGNEDTQQLIDIFDEYGIKATFFVVGA